MKPSFNLVHQPWIPCLDLQGRPVEANLHQALAGAHELQGLATDSPLAAGATLRLLLAVLQRVFGPADLEGWHSLWETGRWDEQALSRYLRRWENRFDLFDADRPFYQRDDDRVEARNVANLMPGSAAGSFYVHAVEDSSFSLQPEEAARWVLIVQTFGLAGICHPQKKLYFTSAPGVGGILFFLEGRNLFQTLALNLLRYNRESPDNLLRQTDEDRPAWEMDDPFEPERQVPLGFLDYLTWQNRRLLLLPEARDGAIFVSQARSSPGLRLQVGIADPHMHLRRTKTGGLRPLQFNPRRALWRDSSALFEFASSDCRPPLAFQQADHLVREAMLDPAERLRVFALGMSSDQAKVDFYRAEHLPLPLAYLKDPSLVADLSLAIRQAEAVHQALWRAVRRLAMLVLAPEADFSEGRTPASQDIHQLMDHWGYDAPYWGALEESFPALMVDLPGEARPALERWHRLLRAAAWSALERARRLAGETVQALKAGVQAGNSLAHGLSRLFENHAQPIEGERL